MKRERKSLEAVQDHAERSTSSAGVSAKSPLTMGDVIQRVVGIQNAGAQEARADIEVDAPLTTVESYERQRPDGEGRA